MKTDILISGFGGQGMMSLGKILANSALLEKKYVVGIPSYGAEIRGGTAHCFIKISDSKIASPFIEQSDIAIILNQPSLNKFKTKLKKGSLLILNSDLIDVHPQLNSIKKISLPLNKIALDCGNIKVANVVALGALVSLKLGLLKKKTIINVLKKTFKRKDILKQNLKAFNKGLILNNKIC